jgi:hypothetical protein
LAFSRRAPLNFSSSTYGRNTGRLPFLTRSVRYTLNFGFQLPTIADDTVAVADAAGGVGSQASSGGVAEESRPLGLQERRHSGHPRTVAQGQERTHALQQNGGSDNGIGLVVPNLRQHVSGMSISHNSLPTMCWKAPMNGSVGGDGTIRPTLTFGRRAAAGRVAPARCRQGGHPDIGPAGLAAKTEGCFDRLSV